MEEKLKENPLQPLPDVSKFDKVFILPVFMKPGKHQYIIKYKDSTERKQKRALRRRRINENEELGKKKYRDSVIDKHLVPDLFLY